MILVIFMGAVCGVAWAVLDYKSSGGDIDRLVSRVETQIDRHIGSSGTPDPSARTTDRAAPPAPGSRKPAARPDAAAATPVVAKVEPDRPAAVEPEPATPVGTEAPPAHDPVSVKPQPVRVPPAVPPSAPLSVESHPFDVVFKAMREAESCLKAGRFEDARSQLSRYEPGRVLEKQRQEFVTLRDRCELHATLLREANITPSMDPPKLTEIEFRVPKGPFTGTVLSRNDKKVELLLLSNIAVTFETFEILQMKDLDPLRARRMVEAEFDRRKSRLSKRRPMDAFRLGEFCLRNGMPDRVAECFDQAAQVASQAGVDLVAVVREEKAEGLYDTFVFFLSIGNLQEARSTLELLRLRYPGSTCIARAEDMERDTLKVANAELSSKIRPKTVEIASAATSPPPAEAGVNPPATPAAETASASVKTPAPPPPAEEPAPSTALSSLPTDKQTAFKKCVDEANRLYETALDHLKRSDPSINPDNWLKENNTAQDLLSKAYALYNQALDIHNDASLWDRVRDTNFKRVLCRKRQINK